MGSLHDVVVCTRELSNNSTLFDAGIPDGATLKVMLFTYITFSNFSNYFINLENRI
jgi:hypothetical protein